jgi:hypothetical protein
MAVDQYGGENGMVGYQGDTYDPVNVKREAWSEAGKQFAAGNVSGAAAGSAFGPWGALIGAGVGGTIGAFTGGFGGRKAAREKRKKQQAWDRAQKQLAQERYQQRVATHNMVKMSFAPLNTWMKGAFGQQSGFDLNATPWSPGGITAKGQVAPSAKPSAGSPTSKQMPGGGVANTGKSRAEDKKEG